MGLGPSGAFAFIVKQDESLCLKQIVLWYYKMHCAIFAAVIPEDEATKETVE